MSVFVLSLAVRALIIAATLRATRDLLPNNTPWSVKEKLIETCIKDWPDIASRALKSIENRLLHDCNDLIKKHFSRFNVGGLENVVR